MADEAAPPPVEATKSRRRIVHIAIGLVLLGSASYCSYGYISASSRVGALCQLIKPGMALGELQAFTREHGLSPTPRDVPVLFVVETRTFGRYGCKVEMERGVVKTSAFMFND